MYVILEAILVGFFCILLYTGLQWIKSFILLLFVLGFLKHSIGYLSGLESLYCNYGKACRTQVCHNQSFQKVAYTQHLMLESFLEGIAFVFVGILLYSILKYKLGAIFLIGVVLHLLSEWMGIHTMFCQQNCRNIVFS